MSTPYLINRFLLMQTERQLLSHARQHEALGDAMLCIDGYPRSANTLLFWTFREPIDYAHDIIHHKHNALLTRWCLRHPIPTFLVVRTPLDAICSFVIYDGDTSSQSITRKIHRWRYYYSRLRSSLNHPHLLLVSFDEITRDVNRVIQKGNEQFDLKIPPTDHDATVSSVRAKLEDYLKEHERPDTHLPLPSETKQLQKAEVLDLVRQHPAFVACETLYQTFYRSPA